MVRAAGARVPGARARRATCRRRRDAPSVHCGVVARMCASNTCVDV